LGGGFFLTWDDLAVFSEHTANDKLTRSHANGSENEKVTTTSLINKEEHDTSEDDAESVLNTGTDQVDGTSESSHLEHVDYVVSYDINTRNLLPSSTEKVRRNKIFRQLMSRWEKLTRQHSSGSTLPHTTIKESLPALNALLLCLKNSVDRSLPNQQQQRDHLGHHGLGYQPES